jgi:hypothetical protein
MLDYLGTWSLPVLVTGSCSAETHIDLVARGATTVPSADLTLTIAWAKKTIGLYRRDSALEVSWPGTAFVSRAPGSSSDAENRADEQNVAEPEPTDAEANAATTDFPSSQSRSFNYFSPRGEHATVWLDLDELGHRPRPRRCPVLVHFRPWALKLGAARGDPRASRAQPAVWKRAGWSMFSTRATPSTAAAARTRSSISRSLSSRPRR